MADGSWQRIDEEDQEDDKDDQNETNDDILLVILPDEVVQALEGAHEPGEGGVWAAEREAREDHWEGPCSQRTGFSRLGEHFWLPQERPENGRGSARCLEAGAI